MDQLEYTAICGPQDIPQLILTDVRLTACKKFDLMEEE